jgi:hypothetical protein
LKKCTLLFLLKLDTIPVLRAIAAAVIKLLTSGDNIPSGFESLSLY